MTVFAFYLYGADHQLFFFDKNVFDIQGVHEILCFFKIKIYSGLWPLSVFQRCVHGRHNGR